MCFTCLWPYVPLGTKRIGEVVNVDFVSKSCYNLNMENKCNWHCDMPNNSVIILSLWLMGSGLGIRNAVSLKGPIPYYTFWDIFRE